MRTLAALVVFTNWLPKASDVGDRSAEVTPVPVNCAVCGEFDALSLTVSVPAREPRAVGVKVIEMVQLVFADSGVGEKGQFDVWV